MPALPHAHTTTHRPVCAPIHVSAHADQYITHLLSHVRHQPDQLIQHTVTEAPAARWLGLERICSSRARFDTARVDDTDAATHRGVGQRRYNENCRSLIPLFSMRYRIMFDASRLFAVPSLGVYNFIIA